LGLADLHREKQEQRDDTYPTDLVHVSVASWPDTETQIIAPLAGGLLSC
jgi:hypothetical protein